MVSSSIFKVFGMTRPGIEPRSPGPLANTLTAGPMSRLQKQDDQHERTFSSYVRIQVVVLKTYLGRWTIGRSGERGSGISVLPARYDDDDDEYTHDTDMWNRHNVHKMFINIYRNPKTRNWFRYETFIHLLDCRGFSTWGERVTQSFYADCFYIISS